MSKEQPSKTQEPFSEADVGAALMAWYADCIDQYPDGLVTQAQAATMLGISRMAVSRLVTRGYLRAVYFPKPPDIVGVAVGHDDPMWVKILGWLGTKTVKDVYAFPKAVYVSFGDVVQLWKSGDARRKCQRDWNEILAGFQVDEKRNKRVREVQTGYQERAELERLKRERQKEGEDDGEEQGS